MFGKTKLNRLILKPSILLLTFFVLTLMMVLTGSPFSNSNDSVSFAHGNVVEGEFVVVEYDTSLDKIYMRAVLADNEDLMLLDAPGKMISDDESIIIRRNYDEDDGFLISMTFFVYDEEFTLDTAYGWLVGKEREDVYLEGSERTITIVYSGERIKMSGKVRPNYHYYDLVCVDVFKVDTIEKVDPDAHVRLSGGDRYITAVEISKSGWDSADTVVLARGDDYADALAGVPLAYQLDAPILLTPTASLNSDTKTEITRLGASEVILLGGTAAISNAVKEELKAEGLTVVRIFGSDRYETAAEVAKRLAEEVEFDTAFIAVGTNFADALAASSYAAMRGEPILLVGTNILPNATSAAFASLGIENTSVCGGTAAVSDAVFSQLPSPTRISGNDRYLTGLALAEEFLPVGTTHVGIATGLNYPDAVAGGVWAAKNNTGILLVNGTASEPGEIVEKFLEDRGITAVTLFGGPAAVSNEMVGWFEDNLGE